MSSTPFTGQVTQIPVEWANDANALIYDVFNAARTPEAACVALGLGTMARQNHNAVSIVGGSLDSVRIGDLWPSVGRFYSLKTELAANDDNDVVNLRFLRQYLAEPLETILTTKGDLLGHSATTSIRLPVGTDGQYLTADPTQASGLRWRNLPGAYVPPGALRGDLLVHNGTTIVAMSGGLDGQFLVGDSGSPTGLSWITYSPFVPPVTTKGDLMVRTSSAVTRLGAGTDGQILYSDSAAATGLRWGALPAAVTPYTPPVTTKGDIFCYSTVEARLPVGVNGQVLVADSTAFTGLRWADPAAGTFTSPLTTKGDLLTRNTVGHARLALGAEYLSLMVAPTTLGSPTGLYWGRPMTVEYFAVPSLTAVLTVATNVAYHRLGRPMTALQVRASLLTASTSGDVVIDILMNGVSILSTKITIEANELTSVGAAAQPVISIPTLTDDAAISISVLNAGTNARGLVVSIFGA